MIKHFSFLEILKVFLIFIIAFVIICILYDKGLVGTSLHFLNSGYRLSSILQSAEAYQTTGQHLLFQIKHFDTITYLPIENLGDDIGIYYFVPLIYNLLGGNIETSYLLIVCFVVMGGFLISAFGIYLISNSFRVRNIGYVCSGLMALFCFFILDIYIFSYFITCFIPLLYWILKKNTSKSNLIIVAIVIGLLIGLSDQFRSQSGTGLFVFIVLFLLLNFKEYGIKFKYTLLYCILILFAVFFVNLYFKYEIKKRDNFLLEKHNFTQKTEAGHVFWHALYAGLGFSKNKLGIEWNDNYVFSKAQSIRPGLNVDVNNITPEYEKIIKYEYFQVIKKEPVFFIKTFLLKFSYSMLFALLFFNFGFYLFFKIKPNWKTVLPFLVVIGFYFLPGILVYPLPMYLLGGFNMLIISFVFLLNKNEQSKSFKR
jgi:hypothetical protein